MSKIVNRLAAAALALAFTPVVGLTAAHAEARPAPIARIPVGDLRLSDPEDAQQFARRAQVAAQRACGDRSLRGLSLRACVMDFEEDLQDALNDRQSADLTKARKAGANTRLTTN